MLSLSSQHLLTLISDTFPGLIAYLDVEYKYQYMNENYSSCYGMDPKTTLGKSVTEVLGEEVYQNRLDKLKQAFQGETVKYTVEVIHQKLGLRVLEQIYRPDFDDEGRVVGLIAMGYDITEQRRIEKNALDIEARFRSLTEVMPQLVWLANADGKVIFINNNWPRLTGTKLEDNLGHGWINTIHHEDRVATLLNWHDSLKSGNTFDVEYRIRMKDGSYRWHMARAIPIKNDKNEIERWVGTTTDIEAQKNAKDIAVAERKRIYSLFMQSPLVILVFKGPDHHVELINPAGQKLFQGKDITGEPIRSAVPETESMDILQSLDEIYHSGEGKTFKSRLVNLKEADGTISEHYLDIFYEPLKDSDGLTTGILNMAVDVTEQVRALKRAEQSEELFRTYAESMPQMAFIANPQGEITYLNQRWYEFAGKDWKLETVYHPEDYKAAIASWNHSMATGEPFDIEVRLRSKEGIYRWHLSRAIPLRDFLGRITQWVGTNTDIHDQKEIEAVQARLLQVLDSSSDFVGMADPDQKAVYINSAGREMIGLDDKEDIRDVEITDLFFEEDKPYVRDVILPTTRKEGKWVGDFRFRHVKTGEERWVHYNSFITHDEKTGDFTGYATVSRDLTEMKQKERGLEEALIARDQFLSIASHELKTPLTSLKLQAQLTLRSLQLGKEISNERQIAMAHQTSDLVGRLTRLIDDMLDVSRIKTGKLQLDKSEQELGNIVREVVLRMNLLFEAAKLKLPSIDAPEKLIGDWDRFRLEQVIGNLLTNAIRYGKGRPIEIKLRRNDDKALLTVTDHGYGIAKKDLTRIFGRFERAINSSEVSGLGLGLFISKEIVETQQGRIWVESEIDKGSTFFIELPLKK